MKEQDAAHSFEEKETCPTCGNTWGDEAGKFCSSSWHLATPYIMNQLRECKSEVQLFKEALITRDGNLTNKSMLDELTRLRSELQQVTQEKESMHIIHCRMLETREKTILKLASELQQEREWISFDEQLPKDYQRVIWFDRRGVDGAIEIGYFVPSQSKIPAYASHWKQLPEQPKKQS